MPNQSAIKSRPVVTNQTIADTYQKATKTKRKVKSYNAQQVALDVIDTVRRGERVNMQKIQIANGYSVKSAKSMKATETDSFKETISPIVAQMTTLRDKIVNELNSRDLSESKMFDLNLLMKNLNHDLQLLQGKSTANHSHINKVVVYGSDDFLALQMGDK